MDTQGHLLAIKVTGADESDQQGGRSLLEAGKERFPGLKLIWGDSHYAGTFALWVKTVVGCSVQTIKALTLPKRGVLVPEGEEVDWDTLFPKGFRPQPRRWVVERTFSWITRSRRTVRDYERLPGHHETMVYWAMTIIMTRRLARYNQSHQLHPT